MNCHLPGSRALSEGAAALSDEMQTIVAQSGAGTAGDLQDPGKTLYEQRNCDLCHTLNEVGSPIASNLSDITNRRDLRWLGEFLKNHQGPEPQSTLPRLKLSDEEAQSLAEYLIADR
jgi:cytochrome c5